MSKFFESQYKALQMILEDEGQVVDVGEWQSIKGGPQARTIEVTDVHFRVPIPETVEELQRDVHPNLPWAEDHFLERVSGEPLNPGEQYKNWPWYRGNVEQHQRVDEVKFSHSYMERYWPKYAGDPKVWPDSETWGLRYRTGDLNDLVSLLARSPHTRQAYLPVWFPEDTGAVHQERVPCSLGYHFLLRGGQLDVFYFIRSCDFFRHFKDDVYMTCRLVQWVLDQLCDKEVEANPADHAEHGGFWSGGDVWQPVVPGNLIMQISSLHVFEAEKERLKRSSWG